MKVSMKMSEKRTKSRRRSGRSFPFKRSSNSAYAIGIRLSFARHDDSRERKPQSLPVGLCEFAQSSVKEWLGLFNLNSLVSFSISKQLSEHKKLLTGLGSIYSVEESVTAKSKICGCQFQNFRVAQRSIRSSFGQEDNFTVFHLL